MPGSGLFNISTKRASEVCFRDLGIEESSVGSLRHWIYMRVAWSFDQVASAKYAMHKVVINKYDKMLLRNEVKKG